MLNVLSLSEVNLGWFYLEHFETMFAFSPSCRGRKKEEERLEIWVYYLLNQ